MNLGKGFTIIELLIVVAIVGILAAIGFVNLPRGQFAVNQTAQGLMRDYQLARFEAIRRNEFVGLRVLTNIQEYQLFQDNNRNGSFDTGDEIIKRVRVAELGGVKVTNTSAIPIIVFDPRGVNSGIAAGIQFNSLADNYPKRVCVSRQGRARIVSGTSCP